MPLERVAVTVGRMRTSRASAQFAAYEADLGRRTGMTRILQAQQSAIRLSNYAHMTPSMRPNRPNLSALFSWNLLQRSNSTKHRDSAHLSTFGNTPASETKKARPKMAGLSWLPVS